MKIRFTIAGFLLFSLFTVAFQGLSQQPPAASQANSQPVVRQTLR